MGTEEALGLVVDRANEKTQEIDSKTINNFNEKTREKDVRAREAPIHQSGATRAIELLRSHSAHSNNIPIKEAAARLLPVLRLDPNALATIRENRQ